MCAAIITQRSSLIDKRNQISRKKFIMRTLTLCITIPTEHPAWKSVWSKEKSKMRLLPEKKMSLSKTRNIPRVFKKQISAHKFNPTVAETLGLSHGILLSAVFLFPSRLILFSAIIIDLWPSDFKKLDNSPIRKVWNWASKRMWVPNQNLMRQNNRSQTHVKWW